MKTWPSPVSSCSAPIPSMPRRLRITVCFTPRGRCCSPSASRFRPTAPLTLPSVVISRRPRKLNPGLHRNLIQAFNKRVAADYDVAVKLTPEEARTLFDQAHEFVAAAETYLNTAASGA